MPLVAAAILPHAWTLIPELDPDAEGAHRTFMSMVAAGACFHDAGVEAIVLAGPHGIRVDGAICIAGTLTWNGRTVDLNVPVDRPLVDSIAESAQLRGVPVARAGYAGNRPDQSASPMDWGAFVPLWFLGDRAKHQQGLGSVLSSPPAAESVPPVVLITPSRSLPREAMVEFGRAVGDAIARDDRRIGFVASCDWSHVHLESGPYGFDPIGKDVDAAIVKAITEDDLHGLIDLRQEDVQRAAIDGLWQTLMLAGVRDMQPLPDVDLLSYEAPSYFGMIVALYGLAQA
jgi:aromatic ring-opening dioxygenase LigB subunit